MEFIAWNFQSSSPKGLYFFTVFVMFPSVARNRKIESAEAREKER